jgi:hypothetical protein
MAFVPEGQHDSSQARSASLYWMFPRVEWREVKAGHSSMPVKRKSVGTFLGTSVEDLVIQIFAIASLQWFAAN